MISKILVFLFVLFYPIIPDQSLQVEISLGKIEGRYWTSSYSPFGNQTSIAFLGIPFVEVPLGSLRFRRPVALKNKWEGILMTKEYKNACIGDPKKSGNPMSEDCLHMNVLTNSFCLKNRNCSILAVIHGGEMYSHSPSSLITESMINNFVGQNRNIIVVNIGYRLGLFGFAHFVGNSGKWADKNVGLYDVLESLKWIQEEIANFGGLKEKVTLFGCSSGGMIAAIMATTPLADGLFHQQFLMSAAPFFQTTKKTNLEFTKKVALKLNCLSAENFRSAEFDDDQEIEKTIECLRNVSSFELFRVQHDTHLNDVEIFGGSWIDDEINVGDSILMSPLLDSKIQKRNTLVGTVKTEVDAGRIMLDESLRKVNQKNLEDGCEVLAFDYNYEEPMDFIQKCLEFYSEGNRSLHFLDDPFFFVPIIQYLKLNSGPDTKVYAYLYEYQGPKYEYFTNFTIPQHAQDFMFLFSPHRIKFDLKNSKIEFLFTEMIANFINYGDPSPSSQNIVWKEFSEKKMEYLSIDFDKDLKLAGIKNGYHQESYSFWTEKLNGGRLATKNEEFPEFMDQRVTYPYINGRVCLQYHEPSKNHSALHEIVNDVREFIERRKTKWLHQNHCSKFVSFTFSIICLGIFYF